MTTEKDSYVLGIDLGTNSIGWAMVRLDNNEPCELLDMGVRIFEAGTTGDIETGKDESRAVERRAARHRRRQTNRQSGRLTTVALTLQKYGLLPPGDLKNGKERHSFLLNLDNTLRAHFSAQGVALNSSQGVRELPYYLRAKALDEELTPYAFGRALYHLAQRRGFLSNRKTDRNEKETGPVKEGIADLTLKMQACDARTLGEYFFQIDPVHEERIRRRWTARSMYDDEFERIWEAQRFWNAELLTEKARTKIYKSIFDQRPLKSQAGTVGRCDLEANKRRAPRALVVSQQFRMLQKINDLTVHFPDGTVRQLSAEERQSLFDYLNERESATFPQIKKRLAFKSDVEFNLERGGEKKLFGNVTEARLIKLFKNNWHCFDTTTRHEIISLIMGSEKADSLKALGEDKYGLNMEEADKFSKLQFEDGYMSLSKRAMNKLLPLMKEGVSFKTAEKQLYDNPQGLCLDILPPLYSHKNDTYSPKQHFGTDIRNPVVTRSLTELRTVVNSIIAKYGKPARIHVELARDMKRSRKERTKISLENRKQETGRQHAVNLIKDKLGEHYQPSRQDIEKVLLMEECGCMCPYTGKTINVASLLGDHPQFDVEHIIPFSRSLSNSFANKTLCHHEENRNVKRNQTPWEAYGKTDKWDEIITRVQRFQGKFARTKLERFQMRDLREFEEMSSQQLNDTRYASKLAARYLGLLYGADANRKIQTNTGQITAFLRQGWHLNKVLGTPELKNRDDHRHHALDALIIALTSRSAIQQLSRAASSAYNATGRTRSFLKNLEEPWDGFLSEVQERVDHLLISRKVTQKIRGRLHKDTIYGSVQKDETGDTWRPVRHFLDASFNERKILRIIDPVIRQSVLNHYKQHDNDAQVAFNDPANHPRTPDGTVIHKARLKESVTTIDIGVGDAVRSVVPGTNHHMEIIEYKTPKGTVKWKDVVVSLWETTERKKAGLPIVNRDHGEGTRFICSLAKGDTCTIVQDGELRYLTVIAISAGEIRTIEMTDARCDKDLNAAKAKTRRNADWYRENNFQKIRITPLGEAIPAND
jgi:CRISPR-associated endonuclease Csn1